MTTNAELAVKSAKFLTETDKEVTVLDDFTGSAKSIDVGHHYIHKGYGFAAENKLDVLAGKVAGIMITVPEGAKVHLQPAQFTNIGGPVYVSLLEDYSFVGGSPFVPVNRNRNSANASVCTVSLLADITAIAGSVPISLAMKVLPGTATGASKLGGSSSGIAEWPLKPGNYLYGITNASSPGVTVTVGYELFWYEETA